MSFAIGGIVEVITTVYLGRWIYPFERGEIVNRHYSPAGQEVYVVKLEDGKEYTFASGEIEEVKKLYECMKCEEIISDEEFTCNQGLCDKCYTRLCFVKELNAHRENTLMG